MDKPVKTVFHGKIISVDLETAQLPDGRTCNIEVVRHPGGAAVVALDENGRVCLLRQYRPAMRDWILELPAGKLDPGETPLSTAQRELEEEAGLRADRWVGLGSVISSPGVFTEVVYLYLASSLQQVASNTEEHELIEVRWLPFDQALDMAQRDGIRDAKTIVGLTRARSHLLP